jgi:hypothetical protein
MFIFYYVFIPSNEEMVKHMGNGDQLVKMEIISSKW